MERARGQTEKEGDGQRDHQDERGSVAQIEDHLGVWMGRPAQLSMQLMLQHMYYK